MMKDALMDDWLKNELRDFVSGLTSEELVYLLYKDQFAIPKPLGYGIRLKGTTVRCSPPQHF